MFKMAYERRFSRHIMSIAVAIVLAVSAGMTLAEPVAAGATQCGAVPHDPDMTPAPTPEYFANFEFLIGGTYENLVVPEGTWCFALGVTVHGNVLVSGVGSKLNMGNNVFGSGEPSTIHGNAEVRRGAHMNVFLSLIGGSYSCDGCLYFGSIANEIGGNVQAVRSQTGVDVWESAIGGNLQVSRNAGPVNVFDNLVGGNLECTRNRPPAVSSGNIADTYVGECSP
jgi:hypothetical protein